MQNSKSARGVILSEANGSSLIWNVKRFFGKPQNDNPPVNCVDTPLAPKGAEEGKCKIGRGEQCLSVV